MGKVRYTLSKTREDAVQHRTDFIEFSQLELASGGPDHHLRTVSQLACEVTDNLRVRAWLIGCYMGPYNVPGGLAIFQNWKGGDVLRNPLGLENWLRDNWKGIPFRRERRPVRAPHKLSKYLHDYAYWLAHVQGLETMTYDELWDQLRIHVHGIGRYSGMKLLEGLRRTGVTTSEQPDIRAGLGGDWSPRLALSYLYPEHDEVLNRTSSRAAAAEVEELATYSYATLGQASGVPDMYHMEVLLCDYKQAVDGKYYPGRPLDSEITQLTQAHEYFGLEHHDRVFAIRSELFPEKHLGEIHGWTDRREQLGETMHAFGYRWSDLRYDYTATKELELPVAW